MQEPMQEPMNEKFEVDAYKLMGVLGQGGQAIVYKAINMRTGQIFAIKKYLKQHLKMKMENGGDTYSNSYQVERANDN